MEEEEDKGIFERLIEDGGGGEGEGEDVEEDGDSALVTESVEA